MLNSNHPKRGSRIKVDPIRDLKDIQNIKKLVSSNKRNYLLFVMGINNGLRASDLLKIKYKDIKGKKEGDSINIIESKTGKENVIFLNKSVFKALVSYVAERNFFDEDYVFNSRKGFNRPLTVSTVNNLIKSWCKILHIEGNYGAHSLRKTFGYIQRTHYGVGFEVLCKRFNHSSPAITMRYLGVAGDEVLGILKNEI